MSSVHIDLPQLVDLALGTPESGAVNFNVLHALLHAVVQLLNADDVRVELIDTQICKPEIPISGIGPRQMTVEEYRVEKIGKESRRVLIEKSPVNIGKLLVVRKSSKEKDTIHSESSNKRSTPEKIPTSTTPHSARTKEPKTFKQNISKGQEKTVVDLEHAMNFAKRLDDTDKKILRFEKSLEELRYQYDKCNDIDNILERIELLERGALGKIAHENIATQPEDKNKSPRRQPVVTRKETIVNEKPLQKQQSKNIDNRSNFAQGGTSFDEKQIVVIEEEVRNLRNEFDQIRYIIENKSKINLDIKSRVSYPTSLKDQRPSNLTKKENKEENEDACSDLSKLLDYKFDLLNSKLLAMSDRILDIEKEVFDLLERFEESIEAKESQTAQITVTDLHDEILQIKDLISNTVNHCNFLISERKLMRTELSKLTKSVNEIAESKVDKDDIDELLSEKADYNMLQRKVSVDYFDANRRDVDNVILDIMTKIQEREGEWCKSLQDLKGQIELKLNASEITAVREYLEHSLQALADRITALCAARNDPEAAGTKIKMLKNLTCISCNRYVLMRTEEANKVPKAECLPARKTIKPFLTYELDNLRKQMKGMPNSRNMHHYEALLKDKALIMDNRARQICTRYCGGSHTIITPQTRIIKGRCGRMFGAKLTTAKCICVSPEPPPCACPDEPEQPECLCPEEPEECSCSSDRDPYEKCMSAEEKRCLDIDRKRREVCNTEREEHQQKCKEEIDKREKCIKEAIRRQKCRLEMERREICSPEIQMRDRCAIDLERRERCKWELEKYAKCKELRKQYQNESGRFSARSEAFSDQFKDLLSKNRGANDSYSNVKPLYAVISERRRSTNTPNQTFRREKEEYTSSSTDESRNRSMDDISEVGDKVSLEPEIDIAKNQEPPEPEFIQEEFEEDVDNNYQKVEPVEDKQSSAEENLFDEEPVELE